MQRLISMGCQTGQGYLFSRPMPENQVLEWIAKHPQLDVSDATVVA
jgi:EAL domain-containing protein (putative c-di-GMP-specific phosphodiesterase class I)